MRNYLANMYEPGAVRVFAVERPDCYLHGRPDHSESWGDYFFFGGPGRSETCR